MDRNGPLTALLGSLREGIGRHAGWNLSGQIVPLLSAALFVPILIVGLGNARFAALTLVWVLLGYFSLFDLGLSRSLTFRIAQLSGEREATGVERAAATGLTFLIALGCMFGMLLAAISPQIVGSALPLSAHPISAEEALDTIRLVALGVPIVMAAAGLRGILEGQSRFAALNAVLIPTGILTFALPAATLMLDRTLIGVSAAVLAARAIAMVGLAIVLASGRNGIRLFRIPDRDELRRLLSFGVWIAVAAIVGPLMAFGDRFVLAALIPLDQVAYYTAPFDIITRLTFVPGAITAVFFPILIQSLSRGRGELRRRYRQAITVVSAVMALLLVVALVFALVGLDLWLGAEFARNSRAIAAVIAIGMAINGLAIVPLAIVQAAGRPALVAKLYLVELPLYVVALYWGALHYGIMGAAWIWTLRVVLDALALFLLARLVSARVQADEAQLGLDIRANTSASHMDSLP